MREIKFRAWTGSRMIENCAGISETPTGWLHFYDNRNHGSKAIMQFTGLKDKKGKEGYHKDLIVNLSRNDGKPHVIEWSKNFGAWVGKYGELEYILAQELDECEIVGNIFEHSNLIEEKTNAKK